MVAESPATRTDLAARLTVQRDGLLELLDDLRAELAQTRIELDRERAVSAGLLPRAYDVAGKTRTDVQRDALAAAGIGGVAPSDLRARFDALITKRNAALVESDAAAMVARAVLPLDSALARGAN